MAEIDLTSDKPLPPSPVGHVTFDALMQRVAGTMRADAEAKVERRRQKLPDPDGTRAIQEDRIRYRQTFVKLRYVLLVNRTECLCGAAYEDPQGLYEESQSSKGGATNLALVVATADPTLPKVIRTARHQCNICPGCAATRHGFTAERTSEL